MGNFGTALKVLVDARGISLREFETTTGIDHSTLSRLMNDQRPSREHLAALCAKACHSDLERYDLLRTHLLDELAAAGLDESKMPLRYLPNGEWEYAALPPAFRNNLDIIVPVALRTPPLAAMLADLAQLVHGARSDNVYPFPQDNQPSTAAEHPPTSADAVVAAETARRRQARSDKKTS